MDPSVEQATAVQVQWHVAWLIDYLLPVVPQHEPLMRTLMDRMLAAGAVLSRPRLSSALAL